MGRLINASADVSEPGLSLTLERSAQAHYLPVTPNNAWAVYKVGGSFGERIYVVVFEALR